MTAVGAIGSSASGPAQGFGALSSDEFMKIVLQELSSQDPMEPSDTGALLKQLSDIRSIQSDMDFSSRLESLVAQNELSSASGLIGRLVSGVNEQSERVADVVLSISRTKHGAVLNLADGSRVPMAQVDEIVDETLFDDDGSGRGGEGGR